MSWLSYAMLAVAAIVFLACVVVPFAVVYLETRKHDGNDEWNG
jgi:uncharacterized paraquat-inducible protein A